MNKSLSEMLKGRKTFFIAPDNALLSQNFMEEYLAKDYECYFVNNDIKQPLVSKVDTIISLFSDAIIFFNIDFHIEGLDWYEYIKRLQEDNPNLCIGVMYEKRKTPVEKKLLEQQYIFKIGIKGGCIQLEYQKNLNFVLIEKVLYANQAMGRRKNVRAICYNNCYFNFEDKKGNIHSQLLNDVSLSHFSITIPDENVDDFGLNIGDVFRNQTIVIKGLRFVTNVILFTKRKLDDSTLYVFAFVNEAGKLGINFQTGKLLITKMYEILSDNCFNIITNHVKKAISVPILNQKPIIFNEELIEQII